MTTAFPFEIERLQKSSKSLIWLNPLLRFKDFSPNSLSIQRILNHVDAFLPIHSLSSMTELTVSLSALTQSTDPNILSWQERARHISYEREASL